MKALSKQLMVGDILVRTLGFGAMRLTGPGAWSEPRDLTHLENDRARSISA